MISSTPAAEPSPRTSRCVAFAAMVLSALGSQCAPRHADGATVSPQGRDPGAAPHARTDGYPLQDWMRATVAPALREGDMDGLIDPLQALAALQPAGLPDWERFARRGASAAQQHDAAGVRAACGACHDRYRREYRQRLRATALPQALARLEAP